MTGRERIVTALSGGVPDRIPCALNFYRVALDAMAPPGFEWEERIDVQFVALPAPSGEQAFRDALAPYPYDTKLGTFEQAANYARWAYHPETPERRNPLARSRNLRELEEHPFPNVDISGAFGNLCDQVADLHARGMAAGGTLPHLGGELFEGAWRLRGLENFLLDLIERPDWADCLLDKLTEAACRNAAVLARTEIDVLSLGDDIGAPGGMLMSPAIWARFFKPRMARIIRAARGTSPNLKVLFHSDGDFTPIIGGLVEIGVDAINPVQPDHMDAVAIRAEYGIYPAIWGAVGRQTTFTFGTPDAIRREVAATVQALGSGGLVLSPAYDLTDLDVPWENVAAFLEAVREAGRIE